MNEWMTQLRNFSCVIISEVKTSSRWVGNPIEISFNIICDRHGRTRFSWRLSRPRCSWPYIVHLQYCTLSRIHANWALTDHAGLLGTFANTMKTWNTFLRWNEGSRYSVTSILIRSIEKAGYLWQNVCYAYVTSLLYHCIPYVNFFL